jgi:DNA-directed RNA polymerase sigma subunit (sigma70/sigma32)
VREKRPPTLHAGDLPTAIAGETIPEHWAPETRRLLASIREDHARIILLRAGTTHRTLQQVGDLLGVTREAVRQAEKKGALAMRYLARMRYSPEVERQAQLDVSLRSILERPA